MTLQTEITTRSHFRAHFAVAVHKVSRTDARRASGAIAFDTVALQAAVGIGRYLITFNAMRDHWRLIHIVQRHPFLLFWHPNGPFLRPGYFRRLAKIDAISRPNRAAHHQGQHRRPLTQRFLQVMAFHDFAPELHRVVIVNTSSEQTSTQRPHVMQSRLVTCTGLCSSSTGARSTCGSGQT
ncbi:Hypothetical protein c2742 [Escherichia coli CFT073]|uniref:Uncharacterized protein n=1 Tax=Escherichia coli O6:H1 (strain CFT073 / ATCC 700928 / UPEC) TaxID=199310 RepID=A0A0H2V952_ECOL6|nr:Hypothetical protein c2742 [Escherichia coli CFT073]